MSRYLQAEVTNAISMALCKVLYEYITAALMNGKTRRRIIPEPKNENNHSNSHIESTLKTRFHFFTDICKKQPFPITQSEGILSNRHKQILLKRLAKGEWLWYTVRVFSATDTSRYFSSGWLKVSGCDTRWGHSQQQTQADNSQVAG